MQSVVTRQHMLHSMFSPRKSSHIGSDYDAQQTYKPTAPLPAQNAAFDVHSPTPTPPRRAHTGPACIGGGVDQQLNQYGAAVPATPTSLAGRPMEAHTGQHRQLFPQLYQSPSQHPGDFHGLPPPRTPSTPLRPTSVEYSSPFFQQQQQHHGSGMGLRTAATPTTPGTHGPPQLQPSTPTSARRMPGMLQPCSLYSTIGDPPAAHRSSSPSVRRVLTPRKTCSDEDVFNFQTQAAVAPAVACPTTGVRSVDFGISTNRLNDGVPRSPAAIAGLPGNYFCHGVGLSHNNDERYDTAVNNNNNNNNIHQKQLQQQQQLTYSGYQETVAPSLVRFSNIVVYISLCWKSLQSSS